MQTMRYNEIITKREINMTWEEKERKSLYYLGLWALGVAIVYGIFVWITGFNLSKWMLPCIFHSLTGYYCPGCGGTRSFLSLLHGHPLTSLYYHPIVVYGAVLYSWYMISNTIEYLSKGKIKLGMRVGTWYLFAGIAIVVINFVIKNGALLFFHCDMLLK